MAIDKRNGFDSLKELGNLNIKRLFVIQKLELEQLNHQMMNKGIYDYNDFNQTLQEIIAINLVITKKLAYEKK